MADHCIFSFFHRFVFLATYLLIFLLRGCSRDSWRMLVTDDLCHKAKKKGEREVLKLREDKNGSAYIQGLREIQVAQLAQLDIHK
jgi:hypothetical protein